MQGPGLKQEQLVIETSTGAVKADGGKLRYDLVPVRPYQDMVKVFTYGATKYADRNYESGMKWSRLFAAMMRHMWSWWGGESRDPETGMSHLAHAACCVFMLAELEYTKPQFDDRVKNE